MTIGTPPPPAKKKTGCGCFGCGCAVLVVIALLFLTGIGAAAYFAVQNISKISSPAAADIPAFTETGGEYQQLEQKLTAFQQSVDHHEPAALHLSAEDLNTLLAHNPNVTQSNTRTYVSLDGSTGRAQVDLPTNAVFNRALMKDRFFNIDVSFTVDFDSAAKSVIVTPQALQIGDRQLLGANADSTSFNQGLVKGFTPSFNQSFNQALRKNSDIAAVLDQAQTITIQNSELVIETK